ncbi:MAG: type II secretion system protein [Sedimentisphaeraceae bacterium JB056]
MKKRGFTLIELLVVISIIAVLMSILMPALAKVREHGKAVVCGTHIKNNLNALVMYAMENDDCAVPKLYDPEFAPVVPNQVPNGLPWDIALRPYFSTDVGDSEQDNVVCPADKKSRGEFPPADAARFEKYTSGKTLPRSYMLNGALENIYVDGRGWWSVRTSSSDFSDRSAKYSQVYEPAKTLWMYDHFVGSNDENHSNLYNQSGATGGNQAYMQTGCIQGSNYWNGIWVPPSVIGYTKTAGDGSKATVSDQHKSGGNWGYIDGHVAWAKHKKNAGSLYHAYDGPIWVTSWCDTKAKKSKAPFK